MKEVELKGNWVKITPNKREAFKKVINELADTLPEDTGLIITEFVIEGTFDDSPQKSFWDKLKFWK